MDFKEFLKLKRTGERLIESLGKHPGRNLMILFFLLTAYALIIFGLYAIGGPATIESSTGLEINTELYQKVLANLKTRDTNIQQGIRQSYPDIFK